MPSVAQLLAAAWKHQQAGRAAEAERGFRQALAADPEQADAWHGLGLLAIGANRAAEAIDLLQRALQHQPDDPRFLHNYGVALRNAGRLDDALATFTRATELNPQQGESLLKRAELLDRLERHAEAVEAFRGAARLRPRDVTAWNGLGIALLRVGDYAASEEAYRQGLTIEPRRAELHNNLGNTLRAMRRLDDAAEAYRGAIRAKPDYAKAHCNLGSVLNQQGKPHEAMAAFQMALVYQPDYAEAHDELGNVLLQLGRTEEAIRCCREAIRCNPRFVNAYNNLGTLLNALHQWDEAERCFLKALELAPQLAEAHNNLGNVYKGMLRLDQAQQCYERALAHRPTYGKAHYNLGNVMLEYGRLDEANACYERAIECSPQYAEAHFMHGTLHLLRGDFAGGWPGYEWRWGMQNAVKAKRQFAEPAWDGGPLAGRTVLLYTEQGLGDTLQFIRYAPLVQQRGGRVVVECQPRLLPLLRTAPGIDQLVPRGDPLPPFDCQAALLSVPGLLQTRLETIPGGVPYLRADPALVDRWGQWLAGLDGFKVGIVWQGSPTFLRDATRSVPLAHYAPLAQVPGVRLIALQKGPGSEQLGELAEPFPVTTLPDDVDTTAGAYMDTAAVMTHLDLVVTSDTSAAHLAGALGRPVWVALGFAPDFRWLLDRDDCPWYPSMRLFRQPARGDWPGVFAALAAALEEAARRAER